MKKPITNFRLSDGIIIFALSALALVIVYPLYYTFMVSICEYQDVFHSGLIIKPHKLVFSSYQLIFELTDILNGFVVSVLVTIIGTFVNLFVSVCGAYALSKKRMFGRKVFITILVFFMLFDGGIIPFYLAVTKLGLMNNFFAMIFPCAVNFFYLFILINYFKGVPVSLEESAFLDGANDITILFRIILPISASTLAAIGLFYAVDRWNEWWHAMLFISDNKLLPLQLILRKLLLSMDTIMGDGNGSAALEKFGAIFSPGLKMASVVITTIPIMLVYPKLSKHFSKGVMVGAIKG